MGVRTVSIPRLTYGDINTEQRTMPLARNTEMERAFSQALGAIESLLTVCHQAGVAPALVTQERAFYADQIDRQARFYGDEDGLS